MVAGETRLDMGPTPAGETMRRLRKLVEDVKCHHHLPCSIFQGPNQFTKIGFIVLANGLLSGFSSAILNQILSLSLSLSRRKVRHQMTSKWGLNVSGFNSF